MKMNMKNGKGSFYRHLFSIWTFFALCGSLAAQNGINVTGIVTDGTESLPGVSIQVEGTTMGTITDMDGNFTLNVPDEAAVLTFIYMGFETQRVTVGNRRQFDIVMRSDERLLDELVVIGYGTARKKDLTGSTSSISGSDIAKIPVTTAAQAITGKVAGVNVVKQSGAPGADIQITVRGGTSITQGTEPLYIVDGFQMENGLRHVDINDIESIDVMKDASATAIYGARGSNGVILITTKSGKSGKTEVSYNGFVSFDRLGKRLDLLGVEDYVKYQYEFQSLRGEINSFANFFGGDINSPDFYSGAYGRIASEYGNRAAIDWQDLVFGNTGMTNNHNVNVSGGSDKTKYILSYNYTGEDEKVHLFYSRWPKRYGMGGWIHQSEIAHAVADTPEGPYEKLGTVLAPRPGFFDATTCHNPHIQLIGGTYYLFYMGNSDKTVNSKRIGVATASSLYGPWQRMEQPLLEAGEEGAWDDCNTTNPAFIIHPNGESWLYYKSWNKDDYRNESGPIRANRKYGLAIAENVLGHYKRYSGNPVVDFSALGDNKQVEDAYVYQENGLFKMLMRDMGYFDHEVGLIFTSVDGIHWGEPKIAWFGADAYLHEPPAPQHLKRYGRFERPQLLMKNGKPAYLFTAMQGGRYETSSGFVFKITSDNE